jgi:hypothetical protein
MIDRAALLADLRRQVAVLEDDLAERVTTVPEAGAVVVDEYERARAAGRTLQSFAAWQTDWLTQAAVAWVLATVFVRFCEDNLLVPDARVSGPGLRLGEARDRRTLHFREHPDQSDREYLLDVFTHYAGLPAIRDLFDEHNLLWKLGPTADGARELLEFWQSIEPATGDLVHDFRDPSWDTHFLGDIYEKLSDSARKKYALLQTPEFVTEFILERTLEPAITTFTLPVVKLIDPACGSGHFLLGAFQRLMEHWQRREPGTYRSVLAQHALRAVHGVDINPFAVTISRFRLMVAALQASGYSTLAETQGFHLNLAVGDSLLHGTRPGELFGRAAAHDPARDHLYASEDGEALAEMLAAGRYHAVVGNPPYITVKDKRANDEYRKHYATCHRQYSMAVPFTERFFDLAVDGRSDEGQGRGGFVGMITANSFMKREFGTKLIEQYLPTQHLTHVIDTSGAYIPGHGTPTVILFARNQPPHGDVRAVLGIRGEPGRPANAAKGVVWSSIVGLVDQPGSEDEYVTVVDLERQRLTSHPWSIGGGGSSDLLDRLEAQGAVLLKDICPPIGYTGQTNADDIMLADARSFERRRVGLHMHRPLVIGEFIRDWTFGELPEALFPYSTSVELIDCTDDAGYYKWLWPARTTLGSRATFAKVTYFLEGRPWWEWHQVTARRLRTPLSIAFAFVATHNHFVLDRGGKLFNRSAPVIKLPEGTTEEEYLGLLGLLNSSTACFWMKQVFHKKGTISSGTGGLVTEQWEPFWEFDGTKLKQFPLTAGRPLALATTLYELAQEAAAQTPIAVAERAVPTADTLTAAHAELESLQARMVAAQEEVDWQCYRLYRLTDDDLTLPLDQVPPLQLGERAFEIVLARKVEAGEEETAWFTRHGSTPVTEIPAHWPAPYRRLVQWRIDLIESDRNIGLIEQPEHKRRWARESWSSMQDWALRTWLLDRLETPTYWPAVELQTAGRLADRAQADADFVAVAQLYAGRPDVDLTALVSELATDTQSGAAVPYVAALRYRPAALSKRAAWERTWDLQRAEDVIDAHTELADTDPRHLTPEEAKARKQAEIGDISVPPKYTSADFLKPAYWKLRGKLDVPKERFILYPDAERDTDTTPVLGWAGWDHLERAQALAGWYVQATDAGWSARRLIPLLAGLAELVPWLQQWHNEPDRHGQRLGDFFATFVDDETRRLSLTPHDLATWKPEPGTRGRRPRTPRAAASRRATTRISP